MSMEPGERIALLENLLRAWLEAESGTRPMMPVRADTHAALAGRLFPSQKPRWFDRSNEVHQQHVTARGKTPYDFNDIIYLTMGLAGEAGEVANEVKKAMRHRLHEAGPVFKLAKEDFLRKTREEIVDTRVYLELLAHALDVWAGGNAVDWHALVLEKINRFAAAQENELEKG
jgi:NTP pyrophosphatase (non-canonical NTP hydrolase)